MIDTVVGTGKYPSRVAQTQNWMRPPANVEVRACAVSVNSPERVYCFNRNAEHPVVIFDRDGNFLSVIRSTTVLFSHAIRIDENDFVWLTDDTTASS